MKTQNQHSESTEALPCVQTPVSRSRFVPMLFSTPMVQVILNGTKTETRRIINPQPFLYKEYCSIKGKSEWYGLKGSHNDNPKEWIKFSKVKVGDIIWVRETFSEFGEGFIYRSDCLPEFSDMEIKWKPSLIMPKKACRLFLEVVSVSVERLQDIDEQSAINEGAITGRYLGLGQIGGSVKEGYFELWDSLNGKSATLINPFVWVYKFCSISVPPDFC